MEPIAILNHNKPEAYLVPAALYEEMLNVVDDMELLKIAKERAREKSKAIDVSLDDL